MISKPIKEVKRINLASSLHHIHSEFFSKKRFISPPWFFSHTRLGTHSHTYLALGEFRHESRDKTCPPLLDPHNSSQLSIAMQGPRLSLQWAFTKQWKFKCKFYNWDNQTSDEFQPSIQVYYQSKTERSQPPRGLEKQGRFKWKFYDSDNQVSDEFQPSMQVYQRNNDIFNFCI